MEKRIVCLALLVSAFLALGLIRANASSPRLLDGLASARVCFDDAPCEKRVAEVLEVCAWDYKLLDKKEGNAVMLKMSCDSGEMLAYMGPRDYLERIGCKFEKGRLLKMEGLFARVNGAEVFVVKNYDCEGETFVLRGEDGSLMRDRAAYRLPLHER